MHKTIYEKNLAAIESKDHELGQLLKDIQTNKDFEVFLRNDTSKDVDIVDVRDNSLINLSNEQQKQMLENLEKYDNYRSLYFFGLGDSLIYQKLLINPKHRTIMVFEPELEVIYIALNLFDLSEYIANNRLRIKLSSSLNESNINFWLDEKSKSYFKSYTLNIYSSYYDKYSQEIVRINKVILHTFKQMLHHQGDSLEDTLNGFKNSTNRILDMLKTPSLSRVVSAIGKRKNIVLVSTGPSLHKQLPQLKKVMNNITIMCADASLPILAKEGIQPDIVLSMERGSLTAKFYEQTSREFQKDTVVLLATVCHEDIFKNIQSDKLSIFMRADKHNQILGFDEWGYLGGGMSCANYLYNFFMNSQIENLVFIGQDLAYGKDGSSHSKNHVLGETEISTDKMVGEIEAYGGRGTVKTMKYWHIFLKDFAFQIKYANEHLHKKTYNATEGGARIPGTIEIPFKEFCEKYIEMDNPKEEIVLEYPTKEEIQVSVQKYMKKKKEIIQIAKSTQKKAQKLFKKIEMFLDKIKDYNQEEMSNVNMKEIEKIYNNIEEVRSKYESKAFQNIFSTLLASYINHLEFDILNINTMRENTKEAIKLKKINFIKVHYEWSYRLFMSLDKIVEILGDRSKICVNRVK